MWLKRARGPVAGAGDVAGLPRPKAGDLWLICGDWARYGALNDAGITFVRLDDLLSEDDCRTINDRASAIAHSWYKIAGKDISLFDGVSLGELMEPWLRSQPILCCLKLLTGVERALANRAPIRRLIVAERLNPDQLTELSAATRTSDECLVIYYARPLIREQISALQALATALQIPIQVAAVPVSDPWLGPGGLLGEPPRSARVRSAIVRWTYQQLTAAYGLQHRRERRTPRVVVSPYNVTLRLMRRWARDPYPPFRLVCGTVLHPRDFLPLARRGALLLGALRAPRAVSDPQLTTICRQWQRHDSTHECRDLCTTGAVSLASILHMSFTRTVMEDFPRLAGRVRSVRRAFRKSRIAAVVVPYDLSIPERILVSVARAQNIPSLAVQHGHYADLDCRHEGMLACKAAVWSDVWRSLYDRVGRKAETIVVTGNPNFDRYAGLHSDRDQLRSNPRSIRRILVLTDTRSWVSALDEEDGPEQYLVKVLQALYRVSPALSVAVKPHPSEDANVYRAFAQDPGFARFEVAQGVIQGFLRQTDLVIGTESTALFEALLMGVPIIAVNLRNRSFTYPLDGSTCIPCVRSTEQLQATVQRLLDDPSLLDEEWSSHDVLAAMGPLDGHATDRLYQEVAALIRDR